MQIILDKALPDQLSFLQHGLAPQAKQVLGSSTVGPVLLAWSADGQSLAIGNAVYVLEPGGSRVDMKISCAWRVTSSTRLRRRFSLHLTYLKQAPIPHNLPQSCAYSVVWRLPISYRGARFAGSLAGRHRRLAGRCERHRSNRERG